MTRLSRAVPLAAAALCACSFMAPGALARDNTPSQKVAQSDSAGVWSGSIQAPGGVELGFTVTFTKDSAGALSAAIDIPLQNVKGLPLADVSIQGDAFHFTIAEVGAEFVGERKDDESITGVLKQSGLEMPFHMKRLEGAAAEAAAAEPKRPQLPKPPFPYDVREVEYDNEAAGVHLAGTLTIPTGAGPHPAALLITGSGAQDRDETIFAHKPFMVIADELTRHGVAVLRVDDRGVGGSTGSMRGSSTFDFVGDVLAGVEFLKTLPEIDPARIGLIGHSEGGVIAPIVASRSDDVAFIVLMAGTGVPGGDLLIAQLAAINRASGVPEAEIEAQSSAQRRLFGLLADGASQDELRAVLRELIVTQAPPSTDAEQDKQIEDAIKAQLAQLSSKWLGTFLEIDPREALRLVRCPVLAINGTLDLQVPYQQNLPEIERALDEGLADDVTIIELPGLNHLFQHATTGLMGEYGSIEETIAPEALKVMTTWIVDHVGPRR